MLLLIRMGTTTMVFPDKSLYIWVKRFFEYLVYELFLWPEIWWGSLRIYLLSFRRFWTLSVRNGFEFYVDLYWMAWHWKPAIKSFIVSVLPLFERHLYSGKRDSFSSFRNLGLTSIQGIPQHSKTVFLITKSVDNFRCVQVTMTSALTEMNYTVKDPINASMRRSRNWTVVKSVCETVSKHWLIDCEAS